MTDMDSSATLADDVEALMATSKLLTAVVARSLLKAGSSVTTPQLRVLVMLTSRGPLNLSGVAEGLGVNASNASRTCEQLVASGLISRADDPTDRRNLVLGLTAAGRELVSALMSRRREVFTQVADRMTPAAREQLFVGLDAFLRAAGELSADEELSAGEGRLLRWLV